MLYIFHPMDEASARAILDWRYDAPYDFYNHAPDEAEATLRVLLDPGNAYTTLTDAGGGLVAYCCFGPDAQVAGGDYGADALDVGLGMRPDLAGQGCGLGVVAAILDLARRTLAPRAFRVTVASFNQRAIKVYQKAGFRAVQTFQRSKDGAPFVVLVRQESDQRPVRENVTGSLPP